MLDSAQETQRILAVDDNTYTLRIVQHTLEQVGYKVSTAVSGPEALRLINRHGIPHLAIVDLHMPKMSGFEFCRAVHEFSDMPVIMLTAVNAESTIIDGLERHAEDYIVKPFNPPELIARVRRVLRRLERDLFRERRQGFRVAQRGESLQVRVHGAAGRMELQNRDQVLVVRHLWSCSVNVDQSSSSLAN